MDKIRPIKVSQLPLIPNDVQPECICVPKVYDWVVSPNHDRASVAIPGPCNDTITELVQAGVPLQVEVVAPAPTRAFPLSSAPSQAGIVVSVLGPIRRIPIPDPTIVGTFIEVAQVRFLTTITAPITIIRTDIDEIVCDFIASIQLDDEVVICLPPPLHQDNIQSRVLNLNIVPTGVILNGFVELDVTLCHEVQVKTDVIMEVVAKFCQPRSPIQFLPPITTCVPRVDFPTQCPSFFPRADCDVQGVALETSSGVSVSLGPLGTDVGTTTINADICPECSPAGSTLSFQFLDADPSSTSGDQSFVYRADQINSPSALSTPAAITTALTPLLTDPSIAGTAVATTITTLLSTLGTSATGLSVTGTGIREFFSSGLRETLSFSLFLIQVPSTTGNNDSYIFTLSNGITTLFATANSVLDTTLAVGACLTFPDLLPGLPTS
jgi:hypothetical protein